MSENEELTKTIWDLNHEKQELESMLLNHNCQMFENQTTPRQTHTSVTPPTGYSDIDFADTMSVLIDDTYIDLSYFK